MVVLLIGVMNVKAITLEITSDNGVSFYEYETKYVYKKKAFKLSIDSTYNIENKWLVNNLAYIANNTSNETYLATIQELIFESINDYEVRLLNNQGDEIDNEIYKDLIASELEKYKEDYEIDGSTYEIDLHDNITIYSNQNLIRMFCEDVSYANYNDKIVLRSESIPGIYDLNFTSSLLVENGYVYSNSYSLNDFSITFIIHGNTLVFSSSMEDYTYKFNVLDEDNNIIDTININTPNNTYYYKDNTNIKLVDISNNQYDLKTLDDITVIDTNQNDYDVYNVYLDSKYVDSDLEILSKDKITEELLPTNITIYDDNNNVLDSCYNEKSCYISLPKNNVYYILDNFTNKKYYYILTDNSTIELKRYSLSGIISSQEISQIFDDETEISFNKDNNIYSWDNIYLKKYTVVVNNKKYTIDINEDNIEFIDNLTYVKVNIDEETNTEDITNNDEESSDSEIIKIDNTQEIAIPDTGINFNTFNYYIEEKKYFFNK